MSKRLGPADPLGEDCAALKRQIVLTIAAHTLQHLPTDDAAFARREVDRVVLEVLEHLGAKAVASALRGVQSRISTRGV